MSVVVDPHCSDFYGEGRHHEETEYRHHQGEGGHLDVRTAVRKAPQTPPLLSRDFPFGPFLSRVWVGERDESQHRCVGRVGIEAGGHLLAIIEGVLKREML